MELNIKLKGKDKKEVLKILIVALLVNIIATIIVIIFSSVEILKTIMIYLIAISYIAYSVYIWIKSKKGSAINIKETFQNRYDPILTRFLIKNEFELDETLLNAEVYYLIEKGYVTIDKENNTLKLIDRNQFKQIDALERIDNNKIKEYSTDDIPSYESMFIGKILFAFHDEIDIDEFRKNEKEDYYYHRGEICELAMERMILYEIEKHNMIEEKNNISCTSIVSILNIMTSIILFSIIGRFNIVLLLANIISIALNVIIVKNENILSYKYSEDIIKYINDLEEYVKTLKIKNLNANSEKIYKKNSEITTENLEIGEEENKEEVNIEEKKEKNRNDEQLSLLFGIQKSFKFNEEKI